MISRAGCPTAIWPRPENLPMAGRRSDQGRGAAQRMIEMHDANRLPECVNHIVIAVCIETIPAIVARCRYANAALEHFMHDSDGVRPALRSRR